MIRGDWMDRAMEYHAYDREAQEAAEARMRKRCRNCGKKRELDSLGWCEPCVEDCVAQAEAQAEGQD